VLIFKTKCFMLSFLAKYSQLFDRLVSPKHVRMVELLILRFALMAFVLHLGFIFLANNVLYFKDFQHSYLKAIYTPFSFILFYEVLLLVIIIPKSISEFIGKQFEVITLITLRSFFSWHCRFRFWKISFHPRCPFIKSSLWFDCLLTYVGSYDVLLQTIQKFPTLRCD